MKKTINFIESYDVFSENTINRPLKDISHNQLALINFLNYTAQSFNSNDGILTGCQNEMEYDPTVGI